MTIAMGGSQASTAEFVCPKCYQVWPTEPKMNGHKRWCKGLGKVAAQIRSTLENPSPRTPWTPLALHSRPVAGGLGGPQTPPYEGVERPISPREPGEFVQVEAPVWEALVLEINEGRRERAELREQVTVLGQAVLNHWSHEEKSYTMGQAAPDEGIPWLSIGILGAAAIGVIALIVTAGGDEKPSRAREPEMGRQQVIEQAGSSGSPMGDLALSFGRGLVGAAGRTLGGPLLKKMMAG